jgi:hypothetical protein
MSLVARVKTWSASETLTASDLNAEFNNILNNLDPDGIEDASANAAAMQATADPYPASSESLATDLRGEIQRLRYQVAAIVGETYWYEDVTGSLNRTSNYAADAEASDTYVITLSPAPSAWAAGLAFFFKPNTVNTGACTINPNSLGAKAIKTQAGADPVNGELAAGGIYGLVYDGTNCILQGGTTPAGVKETSFNATGSAPMFACRAWVNFNGTGTVAIRDSGNVASITDNGTGDYTINFTTNMEDINYAVVGSCSGDYAVSQAAFVSVNRIASSGAEAAPTVSAVRITTVQWDGVPDDMKYINVAIFR